MGVVVGGVVVGDGPVVVTRRVLGVRVVGKRCSFCGGGVWASGRCVAATCGHVVRLA